MIFDMLELCWLIIRQLWRTFVLMFLAPAWKRLKRAIAAMRDTPSDDPWDQMR